MNLKSIDIVWLLKSAKEYIVSLSFLSVFAYSLIVSPFAFNFENYEHGYYTLALFTIIAMCLNTLLSILDKTEKASYYDLILLVPLFFQMYWLNKGNEYASIIATFILQFYLLKTIPIDTLKLILYIIFASYLAEIVFAVNNLISNHSKDLEGSLHNSGVFAIYLITFIPLCRYLMRNYLKGNYFRLFYYIYIGFTLCIIVIVKSRTSLIALILVFVLPQLFFWLGKQRRDVIFFFSVGAGLISIYFFSYLFYLKSASSIGRLLMLKVAVSHLFEDFWWGVGLGKFTFHYPIWQADFFKNSTDTNIGYLLSAGDTYVIFNEFVQLFITVGFVGFVFLLFIIALFFYMKPLVENDLFNMIKRTFLIIMACSLTYYTIHINVVLLLITLYTALSLKILQKDRQTILNGMKNGAVKLLICVSCFAASIYVYAKFDAISKWGEIKSGLGPLINNSSSELIKVYSTLENDGKFLAEYGAFLHHNGSSTVAAIYYLEKSKNTFISSQNIEDLAYLYLEQKNYYKAIENFEWLVNYTPSKFRNRLELLKLYIKTLAIKKAKQLAAYSLNMPIKIPSLEVTAIRKEIFSINQQLINENSSQSYDR